MKKNEKVNAAADSMLSEEERIWNEIPKGLFRGKTRLFFHDNGEMFVCLTDIARQLGFKRPTNAVRRYCHEIFQYEIPPEEQKMNRAKSILFGGPKEVLHLMAHKDTIGPSPMDRNE